MAFAKLRDLTSFTIQSVDGYQFRMWDDGAKKFQTSDTYQPDFKKVWKIQTEHGELQLSPGQVGNLLEAVLVGGTAALVGKTFQVKNNGAEGKDIRYYFNYKPGAASKPVQQDAEDQGW